MNKESKKHYQNWDIVVKTMDREKRKVPIKNVLYMFSYVWDKAEYIEMTFKDNNDDFDSANILAVLFLENINDVLKRGLYKEYQNKVNEIRGVKGKIDFKESLNKLSFQNAKVVCDYDELEENNIINQIIKTTAYKLYKTTDIKKEYKRRLNNVLQLFNDIDVIEISDEKFDILFDRNNYYSYYMIMICKLINDCTMLSEDVGSYKCIDILDDDNKMSKVFERFVYEFYKKKLNGYNISFQKVLEWKMNGEMSKLIPKMKIDILLTNPKEAIIIDTKYYKEFIKENGVISPENMNQMYSYMNNINEDKELRGILLYPVPYNNIQKSCKDSINVICNGEIKKAILQIQTIDLSKEWREIEQELIDIIKKYK